jgi:hypothetical protein
MNAGRPYYIEVWHKERNNDDHMSVLWQWDGEKIPASVPAEVLRPYQLHPDDRNDNGLPDSWEEKTGVSGIPDVHAWQDSDGDGILNLSEYQSGTDPLDGGFTVGMLRWELWFGIPGGEVADLTTSPRFARPADRTMLLPGSSTPVMRSSNFGSRLSGLIVPEADGNHQFALTADDAAELWFSPDENPLNRRLIAFCDVWRTADRWSAVPAQISEPIELRAGRAYYFEVLHKDHHAPGRLDLGWRPAKNKDPFTPIPATLLRSPRDTSGERARGHMDTEWQAFHAGTQPDGPAAALRALTPYGNPSGDRIPNWIKARDNLDPFTRYERPGGLTREWWFRSPGGSLDAARRAGHLLRRPSMITHTEGSRSEENTTNHFVSRLRGTLILPETATYRFWIAGDDHCELQLSDNHRKFHKQLIARVGPAEFENPDAPVWTRSLDWDARPAQRSREFTLAKGSHRFLEILHKDGNGDDHVAVAWQIKLPGQSTWGPRQLIPAEFLHAYAGDPDDRDDDYLPDSWEKTHGLDPADNGRRDPRQGESGDYDADGLTNREEYLLGTDPTRPDSDGDGVSDYDEVHLYGSNPQLKDIFPPVKVADIDLAGHGPNSGSWHLGATGTLIATDRLGFVELEVAVQHPGLHVITITAVAHSARGFVPPFPLTVGIDGHPLGSMRISHTKERNSFLTPMLHAGSHILRLDNRNPTLGITLEILAVEIHFHENTGSLQNDSPGWFDRFLTSRNTVENPPGHSLVSPVCIEGLARHPHQVSVECAGYPVRVREALSGRWYADVPLHENEITPVSIGFEDGAIASSLELTWGVTDLFNLDAPLTLRTGDSIKVVALPELPASGEQTTELLLNGRSIHLAHPARPKSSGSTSRASTVFTPPSITTGKTGNRLRPMPKSASLPPISVRPSASPPASPRHGICLPWTSSSNSRQIPTSNGSKSGKPPPTGATSACPIVTMPPDPPVSSQDCRTREPSPQPPPSAASVSSIRPDPSTRMSSMCCPTAHASSKSASPSTGKSRPIYPFGSSSMSPTPCSPMVKPAGNSPPRTSAKTESPKSPSSRPPVPASQPYAIGSMSGKTHPGNKTENSKPRLRIIRTTTTPDGHRTLRTPSCPLRSHHQRRSAGRICHSLAGYHPSRRPHPPVPVPIPAAPAAA